MYSILIEIQYQYCLPGILFECIRSIMQGIATLRCIMQQKGNEKIDPLQKITFA